MRELAIKAGFRPDQPRVPGGEPDGGQWTDGSGQTPRVIYVGSGLFDDEDDDIPWDDIDDLLDIVPTRPDRLSERYLIARGLLVPFKGRPPTRPVSEILEKLRAPEWLREYYPHLDAYMSPAKTLRELQDDARLPMTSGYDDHHNVERAAALRDGLPKKLIDGPENVLRIPRFKHYEVTA